jgi:hypothetical protein
MEGQAGLAYPSAMRPRVKQACFVNHFNIARGESFPMELAASGRL